MFHTTVLTIHGSIASHLEIRWIDRNARSWVSVIRQLTSGQFDVQPRTRLVCVECVCLESELEAVVFLATADNDDENTADESAAFC